MLLDMHIVHALENGWKAYRDDIAAFRELFPTMSDASKDTWHAALLASEPVYRVAHAPGTPETFPLVTVELLGETPDSRYLSKSAGVTLGRRDTGLLVRQSAAVTIESKLDETLRALGRIIQAVLLRATTSFLQSGYVSFQYEGMDPLGLDEQLIAESLGIYTRHLSYSAEVELLVPEQLPGVVLADIDWSLQGADIAGDPAQAPAQGANAPGGVTPYLG